MAGHGQAPEPIRRFVRDTLGCTCPDSVFSRVDSRRNVQVGEAVLSHRIDVGRRLLVYVLPNDDPEQLRARLAGLIASGRQERDRLGFNRLRVVVATWDLEKLGPLARELFDGADARDERVHLHLVGREAVSGL